MRKIFLPAAALIVITPFTAQDFDRETEAAGVEVAAMDYLDAIYDVKPRYIERSVHPDAVRMGFARTSNDAPFGAAVKMSYADVLEFATNFNKDDHISPEAPRDVKVFGVLDVTASARITTAWGFEYLQLVKLDDEWKIINILWQTFDHANAVPEVSENAVAAGAALFTMSRCTNCHGADGKGGERGPDLTDADWVQSSGDLAGIARTISNGVRTSQMQGSYPRAMGAFSARLNSDQIQNLAQYISSLSNE
jgi:mono/diheme cytochrome c family protein